MFKYRTDEVDMFSTHEGIDTNDTQHYGLKILKLKLPLHKTKLSHQYKRLVAKSPVLLKSVHLFQIDEENPSIYLI